MIFLYAEEKKVLLYMKLNAFKINRLFRLKEVIICKLNMFIHLKEFREV